MCVCLCVRVCVCVCVCVCAIVYVYPLQAHVDVTGIDIITLVPLHQLQFHMVIIICWESQGKYTLVDH